MVHAAARLGHFVDLGKKMLGTVVVAVVESQIAGEEELGGRDRLERPIGRLLEESAGVDAVERLRKIAKVRAI